MKAVFGSFLLIAGLMVMAGSANDCDGACMETANTISEMFMVAFIGLCMFSTGATVLFSCTKD